MFSIDQSLEILIKWERGKKQETGIVVLCGDVCEMKCAVCVKRKGQWNLSSVITQSRGCVYGHNTSINSRNGYECDEWFSFCLLS